MKSLFYLLFASLLLLNSPSSSSAQNDRNLERPKAAGVAEKRVALVIGNAAYTKAKPLANSATDAADMAKALRDVGFEVFSGVDLDKRRMEALIREFGSRLANGGTGLFYYAGHGIQVGGENYLVPVDADIPEEDEVAYSAIPVGLVLSKMSKANNDLNIVILDACRNNPFARSWHGYRDIGNADGLAKISPPTGTLVLYATEPGKVASDGSGRNGLFTESLLKQIKKPNVEYDQMVRALSTDVWQRSNKQQLPWKEGNSLRAFYFVGEQSGKAAAIESSPSTPSIPERQTADPLAELEAWNKVKASSSAAEFNKFLQAFPDGAFSKQARDKMNEIGDPEWNRVRASADPTVYRTYISNNPNSPFITAARDCMNMLADSMIAWEQLGESKTERQLEEYLAKFPDGAFSDEARSRMPGHLVKMLYTSTQVVVDQATRNLAKNPKDVISIRMRSSAYCRQGKAAECKADAEAVLQMLTSPATANEFEAKCYAERRTEKYDAAIVSYAEALKLDPKNSWALYDLANVSRAKEYLDQAIVLFSRAIESDRDEFGVSIDAYIQHAQLYGRQRKFDLAIADYSSYFKKEPKPRAAQYVEFGYVYDEMKNWDSAILNYSKAIETQPDYVDAYFYRASSRYEKNDYDAWIADLNSVIEKQPSADAYHNRGLSYRMKKDYDKALADFSMAIQLDPVGTKSYLNRALIYDQKGEDKLAKADRKKAEELQNLEAESKELARVYRNQSDNAGNFNFGSLATVGPRNIRISTPLSRKQNL